MLGGKLIRERWVSWEMRYRVISRKRSGPLCRHAALSGEAAGVRHDGPAAHESLNRRLC
jgi:hypothetical protein